MAIGVGRREAHGVAVPGGRRDRERETTVAPRRHPPRSGGSFRRLVVIDRHDRLLDEVIARAALHLPGDDLRERRRDSPAGDCPPCRVQTIRIAAGGDLAFETHAIDLAQTARDPHAAALERRGRRDGPHAGKDHDVPAGGRDLAFLGARGRDGDGLDPGTAIALVLVVESSHGPARGSPCRVGRERGGGQAIHPETDARHGRTFEEVCVRCQPDLFPDDVDASTGGDVEPIRRLEDSDRLRNPPTPRCDQPFRGRAGRTRTGDRPVRPRP